jgi:hypothetical protein
VQWSSCRWHYIKNGLTRESSISPQAERRKEEKTIGNMIFALFGTLFRKFCYKKLVGFDIIK